MIYLDDKIDIVCVISLIIGGFVVAFGFCWTAVYWDNSSLLSFFLACAGAVVAAADTAAVVFVWKDLVKALRAKL